MPSHRPISDRPANEMPAGRRKDKPADEGAGQTPPELADRQHDDPPLAAPTSDSPGG